MGEKISLAFMMDFLNTQTFENLKFFWNISHKSVHIKLMLLLTEVIYVMATLKVGLLSERPYKAECTGPFSKSENFDYRNNFLSAVDGSLKSMRNIWQNGPHLQGIPQ